MTADRKAALMEYALALGGELDAFGEALLGLPSVEEATDSALRMMRLETAARLYISSGAMLTVRRWEADKLAQVQAQRAALKAEASPIPSEGGAVTARAAEDAPAHVRAAAFEAGTLPDARLQDAYSKLIAAADAKALSTEVFRAVAGMLRKNKVDGFFFADQLKKVKSDRLKNDLLAEAEKGGWSA